jgi:hypothetical protein
MLERGRQMSEANSRESSKIHGASPEFRAAVDRPISVMIS